MGHANRVPRPVPWQDLDGLTDRLIEWDCCHARNPDVVSLEGPRMETLDGGAGFLPHARDNWRRHPFQQRACMDPSEWRRERRWECRPNLARSLVHWIGLLVGSDRVFVVLETAIDHDC